MIELKSTPYSKAKDIKLRWTCMWCYSDFNLEYNDLTIEIIKSEDGNLNKFKAPCPSCSQITSYSLSDYLLSRNETYENIIKIKKGIDFIESQNKIKHIEQGPYRTSV